MKLSAINITPNHGDLKIEFGVIHGDLKIEFGVMNIRNQVLGEDNVRSGNTEGSVGCKIRRGKSPIGSIALITPSEGAISNCSSKDAYNSRQSC